MHWYDRLLLLWQLLLHANVPEFVLFLAWPPACAHSHVLRILDCESAIYIMACALYQSIQTPKVAISSCPTTATTGTECNSIVISYCDLWLMQARHVACTMPHTHTQCSTPWLYTRSMFNFCQFVWSLCQRAPNKKKPTNISARGTDSTDSNDSTGVA